MRKTFVRLGYNVNKISYYRILNLKLNEYCNLYNFCITNRQGKNKKAVLIILKLP